MFRSILKYTPLLKRILVFVFALTLLVFYVARPLKVSAEAVTITIGVGGTVATIAAKLLPIVLILIGVGYVANNAEELKAKAQELYDNASTALKNWYDSVAAQIIDGTSAFKIPAAQRTEINKGLQNDNKKMPADPFLIIPPSFSSLDTLSQSDVFATDVLSAIEEGNELTQETNSILNKIRVYLGSLGLNLESAISSSTTSIQRSLKVINNNLMDYINKVVQEVYNLRQSLTYRLDILSENMVSVDTSLHNINQNFLNKIAGISQQIKNLSDSLIYRVNNIMTYIDALPQDIASALKSQFSSLQQSLERIEEKLADLTDVEPVAKPQIQVQAGAQTIVVSDYASMGQAFSAKMAWIPDIFNFLAELFARISNPTEPPKIKIHLTAAEGSIDWGQDAYILDMSWYARYKPYVDTILSGILWLVFGWNVYKRLPDILSGVGLTTEPGPSADISLPPVFSEQKRLGSRLLLRDRND